MTKEESVVLWNKEKETMNPELATASMRTLFEEVDIHINSGAMTYKEFTDDMIDMLTTVLIETDGEESQLDRAMQINKVCDNLYEKYKEQYYNTESGEGDTLVSADSTEVPDESGVCESEDTEVVSGDDTAEIK